MENIIQGRRESIVFEKLLFYGTNLLKLTVTKHRDIVIYTCRIGDGDHLFSSHQF